MGFKSGFKRLIVEWIRPTRRGKLN